MRAFDCKVNQRKNFWFPTYCHNNVLSCCFPLSDICMQKGSVFDWSAQPVAGRHPALSERLPAVGRALPGHRPQLHVWLRSGAERRQRLPGPGRSASQHAERAAPLSHQENQQVLFPGSDQRRGPRVCGVMEAETKQRQADRFIPLCQMWGWFSPQGTRQERSVGKVVSILGCKQQKWVNWRHVGCPFSYHFRHWKHNKWTNMEDSGWKGNLKNEHWTQEHLCLKRFPELLRWVKGNKKGSCHLL